MSQNKQFFGTYNHIHVTTDAAVTPSYQDTSKYLFATTKGTINEYKKLLYKKTKYVSKSFTIKILWQG